MVIRPFLSWFGFSSFPRKPESSRGSWTPASAGVTDYQMNHLKHNAASYGATSVISLRNSVSAVLHDRRLITSRRGGVRSGNSRTSSPWAIAM